MILLQWRELEFSALVFQINSFFLTVPVHHHHRADFPPKKYISTEKIYLIFHYLQKLKYNILSGWHQITALKNGKQGHKEWRSITFRSQLQKKLHLSRSMLVSKSSHHITICYSTLFRVFFFVWFLKLSLNTVIVKDDLSELSRGDILARSRSV